MRKQIVALAAIASLMFALPVSAQQSNRVRTVTPIFTDYNPQAANFTYCLIGPDRQGSNRIITSGSSITTTAVDGAPFADVAVGDLLYVTTTNPPAQLVRTVATKASSVSITVNSAWTLDSSATGYVFHFRAYGSSCGTAAANGWFTLPSGAHTISIIVEALGATSVDYSIDGRVADSGITANIPQQLATASISSATFGSNAAKFDIPSPWVQVRVGLKITGAGTNRASVILLSEH